MVLARTCKILSHLLLNRSLVREPPVTKPSAEPFACTKVLPNLHLVSLDLSQLDAGEEPALLGEVLYTATHGQYNPSEPTVIVMEGLSMYLTRGKLQHLIQNHLIITQPANETDERAGRQSPNLASPLSSPGGSSQFLLIDVLGWNDRTNTPDLGRYSWYVVSLIAWMAGERMHFGLSPPVLLSMSQFLSGDGTPHHDALSSLNGDSNVPPPEPNKEMNLDTVSGRDDDGGQWRVIADSYQCIGREHLMTLEFIVVDKQKAEQ
jgi:hypothetical protein